MPILYRDHAPPTEGVEPVDVKKRRKKGGALGRFGRAVKKQFKHGSGDKGEEKKQREPKESARSYGLSLHDPPIATKSGEHRDAVERARQARRAEKVQQLLKQQAHPATVMSPASQSIGEHYKELATRVAGISNKGYAPASISSDEFRPIKKGSPKTRHPHGITVMSTYRTTVGSLNAAGKTFESSTQERQTKVAYHGEGGAKGHFRGDGRGHAELEDASSSMPDDYDEEDDDEEEDEGDYDGRRSRSTNLSMDCRSSIASSAVTGLESGTAEEPSPLPIPPEVKPRSAASIRQSLSDTTRRKRAFSGMEASSLPGDLDAATVVVVPPADKVCSSSTSLVTDSPCVESSDVACQTDAYLWDDCFLDDEPTSESDSISTIVFNVFVGALKTLRDICLCQSRLNKRRKAD